MDAERLRRLFEDNFALHGELGASVSVWQDGEEILSLADGWRDRQQTQPWTGDTLVPVWSATKGPAAACVLHAMQSRGLSLTSRVADVWPEFAQAGKDHVTLGQALAHQAGLPVLDRRASVLDHGAVAAAIAAQAPHWEPGTAHGYSPRAHGFLLDELVRRLDGRALGEYWRAEFAAPLALDFWIGLPAEFHGRVSSIFPSRAATPGDPFYTAFTKSESFTARAFASPFGLGSVASLNTPEARSASLPGFGGIGTARALAKFYSMLASGGALDGRTFFPDEALAWMTSTLAQGSDRVLMVETAFSAGFMRDPLDAGGRKVRAIFGPSRTAFGHPGAGGSHAFADPERRLSFAYVMNQMEPGVLPGPKSLRLVSALPPLPDQAHQLSSLPNSFE
jgi:CubicO group peptidase (beta-lactamase class C family)